MGLRYSGTLEFRWDALKRTAQRVHSLFESTRFLLFKDMRLGIQSEKLSAVETGYMYATWRRTDTPVHGNGVREARTFQIASEARKYCRLLGSGKAHLHRHLDGSIFPGFASFEEATLYIQNVSPVSFKIVAFGD